MFHKFNFSHLFSTNFKHRYWVSLKATGLLLSTVLTNVVSSAERLLTTPQPTLALTRPAVIEPTPVQQILIGSLTGITEVAGVGQILSYAMNQRVQNLPVARNPRHWYRGVLVNAAGMAPITAIQQLVNTQGQRFVRQAQNAPLTETQKAGIALVAGATSALAATPSEAIPVYLQKPENSTKTYLQAMQDLKWRAWRGLAATAGRDGVFTVGYAALAPLLRTKVRERLADGETASKYIQPAELAASTSAGVLTAIATQSLAVVKTKLQADPFKQVYPHSLAVAKELYRTTGAKGFFSGLTARGARVMVAVPVMNYASDFYKEWLVKERS